MPAEYDIDVNVGDSWPAGIPGAEFLITIKGSDGTPVDLTTATGAGYVKEREDDDNALAAAQVTVDVKNQTTNTGEIGIRLGSDQTTQLTVRTYYWGLELTWPDEDPGPSGVSPK